LFPKIKLAFNLARRAAYQWQCWEGFGASKKAKCPAGFTHRAHLILTMLVEFNLQGCFVTIPTKV
jgi:hypothetical protein